MGNEEKETSVLLVILSVLFLIVGWILWGVKKNSAYGIAGFVGFGIGLMLKIISNL